ncbi:MAG: hypothetical protein A3C93_05625 [Candidatus Lloydbacteria bacterium RIFCSPHIGHO2_02_FULL_54_17]|uniref:DUF4446 domain-containing protein n=1 Tax=Candidatus Lloydbacteria bacterium RIFCSPHIGHO2_02_FULL_54_17 TaxID=1798664 RepID=A0A1G2DAV6_9BACT|nr:MAG: hypothetical protein A3C93_05625 [Candidatus Lloydbacteria bacterium RIFCSPHIGHO2_02_FULL_54_17]OGZ13068.1 MAG: hypothetical protein A2948_03605 [Candidatus Lloydbacteria bacterium RIFCSPLOWO2_01_FULL_54_18]
MQNLVDNPAFIAIASLGIAILLLGVWAFMLERRIKKLMAGKSAASLEDTISENQKTLKDLLAYHQNVEEELRRIDLRIKKKLHGAKTVRFNPFQGTGTGGNQSFATALLDEDGNGVVLSTLYSREKVSMFAKPVVDRKSEFELTDEEKEVLKN